MILKGSQRSGARALANHLMNDRDNDHVTVIDLDGFMSDDLHGAFPEVEAISKGTRCKQYLFSLSLNPPSEHLASEQDFKDAADRIGDVLGLSDQPRAIVLHEKEGRRHAHVVWSRIDADEMKAINLPHFKNKLRDMSRELFLDHGWELPPGLRTYGKGDPLNFTLEEWQQARRQGIDPREIKQVVQEAWQRSDDRTSLQHALRDRGLFLARGDRLSTFSAFLRLMIEQSLTVNARNIELQPETPVLYIIDEMPALGRLNMVEQAFGLMAGFGVQIWAIAQNVSQMKSIYGDGFEIFIANAGVVSYFGSKDKASADYFSDLCGVTTVWNLSSAISTAISITSGAQGSSSTSTSETDTRAASQRKLAYPDELMRLNETQQLLLIEDADPILARKLRWFEEPDMAERGMNLRKS